ncbi:MAG: protein translocase subunit SecF [Peptostreptococcales bacterium]
MKLQIIKYTKIWYLISIVVIVVGLGAGLLGGFNPGIDFSGGSMIHIDMEQKIDLNKLQETIEEFELDESIITVGKDNTEIMIKTSKPLSNEERTEIFNKVAGEYNLEYDNLLAADQFSASVGEEIQKKAVIAVIIASVGILIYITIRFEIKFAVAAIIALLHDVLVMIAFYGLFRIPINSSFIAAILVIVGYSINDTIVIFDRIRENAHHYKKNRMEELVDTSINQSLTRSINTSLTALIAVLCVFILGVESIREFTLPIIAGLIAGTYSSIFIASPIWYQLTNLSNKPHYVGK